MTPPSPRASARPTPDPSPHKDPPRVAPSALFIPPTTETLPPADPTTAQEDLSSDPVGGIGFVDEMPPAAAPSSSAPPSTIDKKGIQTAIENGVHLVTNLANGNLLRDELEAQAGLFIAEDDEAKHISKPLANIAARHAPAGAAGNPDLADLIAALLVVAGYLSRNLKLRRELKKAKAEGRVFLHPDGGVQILPPQPIQTEQENAA